ncbi:Beta-galactosidase [Gossypium australe]|uniref:Beta-galactosidase n=1 Tax=Gossypium australe TaxID=47621 RepID=A0A5B6VYY4_9ROSI|nr:Beta-galactosidase [Gossypium australe]
MYSDLGNHSQIYELTVKLGEIHQGEDNVTNKIWICLMIMNGKFLEDCKNYKKMAKDYRIYKFLIGLNVEFD